LPAVKADSIALQMAQSLSFAITNKNMLFLKDRIANAMLYVNENINWIAKRGQIYFARMGYFGAQ